MILQETLSKKRTLWFLFTAVLLMTAAFPIASSYWDITFIDAIYEPKLVRDTISSMSADQRSIHAWITSTLDVAYPFAYGAFFAGSSLAFFPSFGRFLAIPAYLVVPTDLAEGIIQVLALVEIADWIDLKAVLTPMKTILFLAGLLITICGWSIWLASNIRGQTS